LFRAGDYPCTLSYRHRAAAEKEKPRSITAGPFAIFKPSGLEILEALAFLGELFKQRRRRPFLAAERFLEADNVGIDLVEADIVGIARRAAAIDRPAIAIDPDHVDIARPRRDAFFKDLRGLVDHRIDAALEDFLIRNGTAGDALLLRDLLDNLLDHRIGDRRPAARLVAVIAGIRLLAEAAKLADGVGDRAFHALALADAPAHVIARKVAHGERAHREAEVIEHPIDILDLRAFQNQLLRLFGPLCQHPVADEAVTDPHHDRDLADLLGKRHAGRHDGRARLFRAHFLKQLHNIGGAEEMKADDIVGPRGDRADLVDIERRGVGREDGALLTDPVEFGENLFLHIHIFEDRLDNDIGIANILKIGRACKERHIAVHLLLREAALGDRRRIILADDIDTAVKRLLRRLDDGHRNAGLQEIHGNAAAHGAGADDARGFDVDKRGIRRDIGDFRGLPLGEEDILLRLRLLAGEEFKEQLPLTREGLRERQVDRRLD